MQNKRKRIQIRLDMAQQSTTTLRGKRWAPKAPGAATATAANLSLTPEQLNDHLVSKMTIPRTAHCVAAINFDLTF